MLVRMCKNGSVLVLARCAKRHWPKSVVRIWHRSYEWSGPDLGQMIFAIWDECQPIVTFWNEVFQIVSELCDTVLTKHPGICLLNDNADLKLTINQRRFLYTALTAAKKLSLKAGMNLWSLQFKCGF